MTASHIRILVLILFVSASLGAVFIADRFQYWRLYSSERGWFLFLVIGALVVIGIYGLKTRGFRLSPGLIGTVVFFLLISALVQIWKIGCDTTRAIFESARRSNTSAATATDAAPKVPMNATLQSPVQNAKQELPTQYRFRLFGEVVAQPAAWTGLRTLRPFVVFTTPPRAPAAVEVRYDGQAAMLYNSQNPARYVGSCDLIEFRSPVNTSITVPWTMVPWDSAKGVELLEGILDLSGEAWSGTFYIPPGALFVYNERDDFLRSRQGIVIRLSNDGATDWSEHLVDSEHAAPLRPYRYIQFKAGGSAQSRTSIEWRIRNWAVTEIPPPPIPYHLPVELPAADAVPQRPVNLSEHSADPVDPATAHTAPMHEPPVQRSGTVSLDGSEWSPWISVPPQNKVVVRRQHESKVLAAVQRPGGRRTELEITGREHTFDAGDNSMRLQFRGDGSGGTVDWVLEAKR